MVKQKLFEMHISKSHKISVRKLTMPERTIDQKFFIYKVLWYNVYIAGNFDTRLDSPDDTWVWMLNKDCFIKSMHFVVRHKEEYSGAMRFYEAGRIL